MAVHKAKNMTTAKKHAEELREKGLKAHVYKTKKGVHISSTRK